MKGDIVVLTYPFSDFTHSKRRPALVVASAGGDDLILCQMTSRRGQDPTAIRIEPADVAGGTFQQGGFVRPNRLFTADKRIVHYRIGAVKPQILTDVIDVIVKTLQAP
jgi:mRNA interferase MazF